MNILNLLRRIAALIIQLGTVITSATQLTLVEVADCGSAYEIDWDNDTFLLTMTEDCVFTETNLPDVGRTKTITIDLTTGGFTATLPEAWDDARAIIGNLDLVKYNLIVIEYRKANNYWTTISQDT